MKFNYISVVSKKVICNVTRLLNESELAMCDPGSHAISKIPKGVFVILECFDAAAAIQAAGRPTATSRTKRTSATAQAARYMKKTPVKSRNVMLTNA